MSNGDGSDDPMALFRAAMAARMRQQFGDMMQRAAAPAESDPLAQLRAVASQLRAVRPDLGATVDALVQRAQQGIAGAGAPGGAEAKARAVAAQLRAQKLGQHAANVEEWIAAAKRDPVGTARQAAERLRASDPATAARIDAWIAQQRPARAPAAPAAAAVGCPGCGADVAAVEWNGRAWHVAGGTVENPSLIACPRVIELRPVKPENG